MAQRNASPLLPKVPIKMDSRTIWVTPDNCKLVNELGRGSYGEVVHLQHLASKLDLACKTINLSKENIKSKYIQTELETLAKLKESTNEGIV